MTDGQPNIIGPLGTIVGLGVLAYGAKTVIDVMKEKALEDNKKKKQPIRPFYNEPRQQGPRITANTQADDRITSGLNKMLGR